MQPKHPLDWQQRLNIPLPQWHQCQGASNDCGPFSAAIAANALRNQSTLDAKTLADMLDREATVTWNRWLPSRVRDAFTFPWGLARALRKAGFKARWQMGATTQRLLANLKADRPTIVLVGDPLRFEGKKYIGWAHWKTLYAWDERFGWSFVDSNAKPGLIYSFDSDATFRKTWRWFGHTLVELWDDLP